MRIILPNGEKEYLDTNLSLEEKMAIVESLVSKFEPIIISNWNSNSIKQFLNNMADYIIWHKEQEDKGKEDKDYISKRKTEEINGKRRSHTKPFSSLDSSIRENLLGDSANERVGN